MPGTAGIAAINGAAEDVAEVVAMAATNPNLTGTVIEADDGARLVSLT